MTYDLNSTLKLVQESQGFNNLFHSHQMELLAAVKTKTGDGTFMPLPVSNGQHSDFHAGQLSYRISRINGTLITKRILA